MDPQAAVKAIMAEAGVDDRWIVESDGEISVGEYTDYDDVKESESHAYDKMDEVREDLKCIGYEICSDGIEHDYVGYSITRV